MLQQKREFLQKYSKEFIAKLKILHRNFSKTHIYPTDKNIRTAIYDSDKIKIFSLLKSEPELKKVIYKTGDQIHFIKEPESYYLGAKYVVFEIDDDAVWFRKFLKKVFIFGIPFFAIVVVVGFFLMKLFLKPMRDTVILLDRFIKDTTHELNTPVSAILVNIEMIDRDDLREKNRKKIDRIDIATRTISNIYQDLTYLSLNHKIQIKNEDVNLSQLIIDRSGYFSSIAKSKKIKFILDIEDDVYLYIDKNRITRVIDNLISNAIKYNRVGGEIKIELKRDFLTIRDNGVGIPKEKIGEVFDRYKRFDTISGGFGIGLNIVKKIADEYSMKINIESKKGEYTKITIKWGDKR